MPKTIETVKLENLLAEYFSEKNDKRKDVIDAMTLNEFQNENLLIDCFFECPICWSKQNYTRPDFLVHMKDAKGISHFVVIEIKRCKSDIVCGTGLNFVGNYNYVLIPDNAEGRKAMEYVANHYPYVGILTAVNDLKQIRFVKKSDPQKEKIKAKIIFEGENQN